MARVINASDLVSVNLEDADIQAGIKYGIIARAWHHDRMGAQARGDFGQAMFHIAVGKAMQSAFERYLISQGVSFERDNTDYKTKDYWDIRTSEGVPLDIKSFHYYSDFHIRERLAPESHRIITSSLGETWNSFYPMLVPQDQFDGARKDVYVFALLSAPGSKRFPRTHQHPKALVALPFSQNPGLNNQFKLVHSKIPSDQRVRKGQTFEITIRRRAANPAQPFHVTIGYGDLHGADQRVSLKLELADEAHTITQVTSLHYLRWHGDCPISTGAAHPPLLDVIFHHVERLPDLHWQIYPNSFEDIWIYPDAAWFLGWITGPEFERISKGYPSYQPNKQQNKNEQDPEAQRGGMLPPGSFCYYYPPVGGGTRSKLNYYVLPQDLNPMSTLIPYLTER
jgi:hypothetical protein